MKNLFITGFWFTVKYPTYKIYKWGTRRKEVVYFSFDSIHSFAISTASRVGMDI